MTHSLNLKTGRTGIMKLTERKKGAFVGILVAAMGLTVLLLLVNTFFCRYGKKDIQRLYGDICTSFVEQAIERGEEVTHVRVSVGESFDNDFLWDEETCAMISEDLAQQFSVEVSFSDTAVTPGDTGCLFIQFDEMLSRNFTTLTLQTRCVGTTWKRTLGEEVYLLTPGNEWVKLSTTGKNEAVS